MKDVPDRIKPFTFHGCDLSSIGNQRYKGDCPVCSKTDKFFVNEQTGQWDCKGCLEKGNVYTFLTKLHTESLAGTTEKDLEAFAKDRHIPAKVMKEWGLAKSVIDDTLILPAFKDGKLVNLSRVVKEKGTGKWLVLSTPGCKQHPFGTHLLTKSHKNVIVTEGPWDGMATHYALQQIAEKKGGGFVKTTDTKTSLHKSYGVLAVPGAGAVNEDHATHLANKVTHLCFDNDHPKVICRKCKKSRPKKSKACECGSKDTTGQTVQAGWQGTQRAIKVLANAIKPPKAVHALKWGDDGFDEKRKSGYDLRDLLMEQGPLKGLETLFGLLEHINVEAEAEKDEDGETFVEPLDRSDFKQLCKDFETTLHFTQPLRDTLAIMLAVVISTDLKGDQLWLRVIGPPGSGKTTLAECLSVAKEYVYAKSIFTGFHSGFIGQGPKHAGKKKDFSLIPLINNKTFCIKEGDNLLTAPNRDRILSELRDLYDGTSRTSYRHGVSRNYESIQTTFIVCGTDSLRGLNRSSLGDRFIDCETFGSQSSEPFLDRALKNTFDIVTGSLREKSADCEATSSDKMLFLKRATYGYVKYLKENLQHLPIPTLPDSFHKKIKGLGQFLAYIRARGHRDDKDAGYRPRVELATRLVSQFTKLAICLALVQGKKAIDDEIIDLLRKVVIDTATSYHLEIVQLLSRYPNGAGKKELSFELKISEESVRQAMWDMQRFGLVTRKEEPNHSGIRGRNLHIWQLSPTFKSLMDEAFGSVKKIASKGLSAATARTNPIKTGKAKTTTKPSSRKATNVRSNRKPVSK